MAAYAALVSLTHTINEIQRHPSPPISIHQHKQQLQSLTQKVNSLLEFLERFDYKDEADPLEIRIADVSHAAEDVINSFIVDTIRAHDHRTRYVRFHEGLQKAIEEMDSIEKMAGSKINNAAVEAHGGLRSTSRKRKSPMVGFDEEVSQLLDRLTGGNPSRHVIPIVGMGGIGKTTLATNVFELPVIKRHFHVSFWATVSQEYNIVEILERILHQARSGPVTGKSEGELISSGKSKEELGEELHKYLFGRRYLIVLDDMWSIKAWETIQLFFPKGRDGSRVLVTTRMSNLAAQLSDSDSLLGMRFLDEVTSWCLFSTTVFSEGDGFPPRLEEIGKKIVEKCNGLPLAILVVGGLLAAKSQHTQESWEQIENNLGSIVNSESENHCFKILKLSNNYLPAYLKPCFLYMGAFEEDRAIRVSTLVKLWLSEGFLKPKSNGKSLETVAEDYLEELIDRNLVIVHELGLSGNIKYIKLHDLLRDLSLREAQRQSFYHVLKEDSSPRGVMTGQRRIVVPRRFSDDQVRVVGASESTSNARSYICHTLRVRVRRLSDFKLLRMLHTYDRSAYVHNEYLLEDVLRLVNLRYLAVRADSTSQLIPSSIDLLWNLHILIISSRDALVAPVGIWKMHQLRHVECTSGDLFLPPPPLSDIVIMENLHTLIGLKDLYLSEEVVKRIPNIKKLGIRYVEKRTEKVDSLNYLQYLSKLETFRCTTDYRSDSYMHNISLPHSLKKLTMNASFDFELDEMVHKVGSLPLLQRLVIGYGVFKTEAWETVEGEFPSLKSLTLFKCGGLESWTIEDSSHFPLLQEIRLYGLGRLEGIPLEIGEISTLKSLLLDHCSEAAMMSAKEMVDEQEDLHGDELDFEVRVVYRASEAPAMQFLEASPNYHIYQV